MKPPADPSTTGPGAAALRASATAEAAAERRRAAAERALAEAAERRAARDAKGEDLVRPGEIAGRGGLDPVRYDDWEVKGIASDF